MSNERYIGVDDKGMGISFSFQKHAQDLYQKSPVPRLSEGLPPIDWSGFKIHHPQSTGIHVLYHFCATWDENMSKLLSNKTRNIAMRETYDQLGESLSDDAYIQGLMSSVIPSEYLELTKRGMAVGFVEYMLSDTFLLNYQKFCARFKGLPITSQEVLVDQFPQYGIPADIGLWFTRVTEAAKHIPLLKTVMEAKGYYYSVPKKSQMTQAVALLSSGKSIPDEMLDFIYDMAIESPMKTEINTRRPTNIVKLIDLHQPAFKFNKEKAYETAQASPAIDGPSGKVIDFPWTNSE